MIEKPDMVFGLMVTLLPAFIGLGITLFYFASGRTKNRGMIPVISCLFFVFLSMAYFGSQVNDYRAKVYTLIHETPCEDLPSIANDYNNFKSDVIDEIVLRCLINQNNPELAMFVREGGT